MRLRTFCLVPVFFSLFACSSEDSPNVVPDTPPVSTTSGSMATISSSDTTYAFIPRNLDIVVVPVTTTSLAGGASSIATVTLTNVANSCTADPTAKKVVCVGYANSSIAILDVSAFLATGGAISVNEIDSGVSTSNYFSGGSCTNCGVIADPDDGRFVVSSGDGYRVFNYSGTLLNSYLTDNTATPVVDLATENFGFDPVTNLIYSPEYETTNNYLWVINIETNKIYRWTNRMVDTITDATNGLVGLTNYYSAFTADAAAIDSTTGMVVVGDEWTPRMFTINMNDAVFNDTAGTFTAPYAVTELDQVYSPYNWLTTGVAIESGNHLMLMEEEFGDAIGIAQMATATMSGAFTISNYISATVPSPVAVCTSTPNWYNIGDPHGLAVYTAIVDGRSWGLLINSTKDCAAVVDMQGILDAPRDAATNKVDPAYDLVTNNLLTFVSLN